MTEERACRRCGARIAETRPADAVFCGGVCARSTRSSTRSTAAREREAEQRRAQRHDRIDAALQRAERDVIDDWRACRQALDEFDHDKQAVPFTAASKREEQS